MEIACVHCGGEIRVSRTAAGQSQPCPHCHATVSLPALSRPDEQLPNDDAITPRPSGVWSNAVSGLASLIVHTLLLIACAFVTWNLRDAGEGDEVLIGTLVAEQLTDGEAEQLQQQPTEQPAETEPLDEVLLEVSPTSLAPGDESSAELTLAVSVPSGGASDSGEIGTISGGGGALGEGASFMGVYAQGRRFCIIADRSGSMQGPKMEYVKEEILETLSGMRRTGRAQIVFFNSAAQPYPKRDWLHPAKERTAIDAWLRTVGAGGGTYPTPAFQHAMTLRPPPDGIFFMTDGQFDAGCVEQIRRLNTRGQRLVPIYAITFLNRSGEAIMKKIAEDSGGTYRHVAGF